MDPGYRSTAEGMLSLFRRAHKNASGTRVGTVPPGEREEANRGRFVVW